MCASTSVATLHSTNSSSGFAHETRVRLGVYDLDLRTIKFKHAHLKFTVYGHKQASIHTHVETLACMPPNLT